MLDKHKKLLDGSMISLYFSKKTSATRRIEENFVEISSLVIRYEVYYNCDSIYLKTVTLFLKWDMIT